MVRLTDCPDMTLDVYRGCKTTKQLQLQLLSNSKFLVELFSFFGHGILYRNKLVNKLSEELHELESLQ